MPINPAMAQPIVAAWKSCGEPRLQLGDILWINPGVREALPSHGRGERYFFKRGELREKS
jgi:hypothetical protein